MNASTTSNWEQLDAITQDAARTILACFREADLPSYKHFLNSMYHYTLNSGERLEFAAANASGELKDFYTHLADDEESHFLLAEADLREFGEAVDPDHPPAPVRRFHEYWQSLAAVHPCAWLGVLYVAENIAKFAEGSVLDMFPKLQLTKAQTRWLRVHAEVDLEHGAEVQQMCEPFMAEHGQLITDAARQMGRFWVEIMQEGLQVPRAQ